MVGYTGASIGYISTNSKFNPTINITDVSVSTVPSGFGDNITFSMHLQTFTHAVTVELSGDQSLIRVFTMDPGLVILPVDDCSWYPSNTGAVNQMDITSFQDMPWYYMHTDAPVVSAMPPFSSVNYTVSFLIMGPIANYTAIDPTPIRLRRRVQTGPVYDRSLLSGQRLRQLQTVSGECEGSSSG